MITRWTGREAHELGRALRMTVEGFAEYLGVSRRAVEKWRMLGQRTVPRPDIQAALDTALQRAPADARDRFRLALASPVPERATTVAPDPVEPPARRADTGEETVRFAVQRSMSRQGLTGRELDDWERVAMQHERRAGSRPVDVELADLLSDAHEVSRHLERPQASSTTRRLTRLVGRLARLVSDRLDESGQRSAARRWAQIARVAAAEADGPARAGTRPPSRGVDARHGLDALAAPEPGPETEADGELAVPGAPLAGMAGTGAAAVGPVTEQDVAGLAALVAERDGGADGPADLAPIRDAVVSLLDGADPVRALVARIDDEVAGLASFALDWPAAGGTRALHLHELYVVRAQRDRGVGRSLMVALARLARDEGCSRIEWTARRDDERAREVSARLGAAGHPATWYEVPLDHS